MKMYNLFIPTFFVLINFSAGVSIPNEAEMKDNVYFSYEKNLEILKINRLDYLDKDLDQIYEGGYELVNAFWYFFENKQDLLNRLVRAYNAVIECMFDEMEEAMDSYDSELEKLSKILEESPKSPTCYEDMVMFCTDSKRELRKALKKADIQDRYRLPYIRNIEIAKKFMDETVKYPDTTKKVFQEYFVNEYISFMTRLSREKTKKKDIRGQSKRKTTEILIHIEDILQFHRENDEVGMLNENGVLSVIGKLEETQRRQKFYARQLSEEIIKVQTDMFDQIDIMEKMATATFYIIDDNNNKILVDCEDHVPYFWAKPSEYLTDNGKDMTGRERILSFTGIDEHGRKYDRIVEYLDSKPNIITLREIIEYDDEVFDRKYYIEFDESIETHVNVKKKFL